MKKILAVAALTLVTASAVVPTMAEGMKSDPNTIRTIKEHDVTVQINDIVIDNEKQELRVQVKVQDPKGVVEAGEEDRIQVDFFEDIKLNGKVLNTGSKCDQQVVDDMTVVWDMVYPLEENYEGNVHVDFDVKQVRTRGYMIMEKWQFDRTIKAQ